RSFGPVWPKEERAPQLGPRLPTRSGRPRGVVRMAERRLFSVDGYAAGFALAGALLAGCVLWPYGDGIRSDRPAIGLTETLGEAVYVLLAGWACLTFHLVVWRRWARWAARAAGWASLTLAAAVAGDWWAPEGRVAALAGAGGSGGAWLAA